MTLYQNSETMYNNHYVDNTSNRVYINPNFNRPTSYNPSNSTAMHVNPRFPHLLTNNHPVPTNKARIYVNPNFMKSKSGGDNYVTNTSFNQVTCVASSTNVMHAFEPPNIQKEQLNVPVPIAKSRYCLVRQNANKVSEGPSVEKIKSTYQVNKYKSIPLNDIKRSLDNAKNAANKRIGAVGTSSNKVNDAISTNKKYFGSTTSHPSRSQLKLINRNVDSVLRNEKTKSSTIVEARKRLDTSQGRLRKVRGNLKKNNIPCPTYRKFGKCLRKEGGKCDFLHDKKHVSICRKFIKGLCHDETCLFSHDLTAKKMPTCYFYLQGTCTKPNCPYLHVKLSEKVKICPDFLKGYCEKGSKCLLRHIQPENKVKDSIKNKSSLSPKRKYSKMKSINMVQSNVVLKQGNEKCELKEKSENNTDYRYYQEHKEEGDATADICEVIKPTRCKLGTLPSFIQL